MTAWCTALLLDLLRGEPPSRMHPVVWMGRLIGTLDARAPGEPRAQLRYGALIAVVPAIVAALFGVLAGRVRPRLFRWLVTVWLLKTTFSVRALVDASEGVAARLDRDDLDAARDALGSLVSREHAELDREYVASAAIESEVENLGDSYVAPLFWYLVGGLPAALAYRAVNTADAMVGYRGHYEYLGKASARLDDAMSYLPSRASALGLIAGASVVGMRPLEAVRALVRDRSKTASPNSGWPMSAAAGALGVWLEKKGDYRLGKGRAPGTSDILAARKLVLVAVGLCTLAAFGRRR